MRNFFIKFFLAYLCCQLFLYTPVGAAKKNINQNKPLRIAVAANFSPILKELLSDFTHQNMISVQVISAATGTLYQQAVHGAPFDIFLSADAVRPKLLEDAQLVIPNSRKTYAYGQIALWSATKKLDDLSILAQLPSRLAIANPATAPYGKAAKQALEHLSLWHKMSGNLITGININQTFQQVRSQAAQIGIVALSQLRINNFNGVVIPQKYHRPIAQQLVILKSSKQVNNAKKLSEFLLRDDTQSKLINMGYLTSNIMNTETAH